LPEDHPYVVSEVADVNEQLMEEESDKALGGGHWDLLRELVLKKLNQYRLFLTILIQMLGQFSGANAITIYAPEFFAMVGMKGTTNQLMMTAILGVVKLTGAYIGAFFLIDFLGRRRLLYVGLSTQLITMLYFAIYLKLVPQAAEDDAVLTTSQNHAGKAAMACIYLNGMGWTMGWNSIQYLINSEIFALRLRLIATGAIMVFHFACQYGNSKAVPSMFLAMGNWGTILFFAGICAFGLFFCWFFMPEVSGRLLESMEAVFLLPWYKIGRYGHKLCPDTSEVGRLHYNENEKRTELAVDDKASVHEVESV